VGEGSIGLKVEIHLLLSIVEGYHFQQWTALERMEQAITHIIGEPSTGAVREVKSCEMRSVKPDETVARSNQKR